MVICKTCVSRLTVSVSNQLEMKFCSARLSLAQSLVALSVSLAIVLSSISLTFASPTNPHTKSVIVRTVVTQNQTDSPQADLLVLSAIATVTAEGLLIRWRTNSATNNVGFHVYRHKEGDRTRANPEVISGL